MPSLKSHFVAVLALVCCGAQAQNGTFQILHGDQVVGSIVVERSIKGNSTAYSMVSLSSFVLVWKRSIRTTMTTQYINGQVTDCHSAVRMNNTVQDSSRLRTVAGKGLYFIHPSAVYGADLPTNAWTTARMYYEEPTGIASIFVESALKDCPLDLIAAGEYRLTLPNKTRNHYIYRNGTLQEIRVDRGWVDLVFRRN